MSGGHAVVLQGNAAALPLPDESVHLIVTSPPYFALRSYQDAGGHYDGQVGGEPTWQEFLESLWRCTEEMVRVLHPQGSLLLNLGDKYSGAGGPGGDYNAGGLKDGQPRYDAAGYWSRMDPGKNGIRAKSLMGLPWRYALGCIDRLGLILRAEIVWSKINGLPESVEDRVRRSHEQWFHFTKAERYYSAMDEIREDHAEVSLKRAAAHRAEPGARYRDGSVTDGTNMSGHTLRLDQVNNPRGKLPGSVWSVAMEPLVLPDYFVEDDRGWRMVYRGKPKKAKVSASGHGGLGEVAATDPFYPGLVSLWRYAEARHREGQGELRVGSVDHFAAFPTEWPRRLITAFSPPGICTVCGEGRRPVTDAKSVVLTGSFGRYADAHGPDGRTGARKARVGKITGYACACTPFVDHPSTGEPSPTAGADGRQGDRPVDIGATHKRVGPRREYLLDGWEPPPTTPSVVLDPFGGTGTTAMVARTLGRVGITVDLSRDYCKLARWRIFESGHGAKAARRSAQDKQGQLL